MSFSEAVPVPVELISWVLYAINQGCDFTAVLDEAQLPLLGVLAVGGCG